MPLKAMDLFDAFAKNMLPKDKAYLVSSFINENNGYTKYEIVSYSAVKAIYPEENGITFQSSGKKLYILVEPSSYPNKAIEPYLRVNSDQIPLRFKELDIIKAKNQITVMIAQRPNDSLSSFTIAKPSGSNISFVFYYLDDLFQTMAMFFETSLNKDARVPLVDAKKASLKIIETVKNTMAFVADYA